MREESEVPTSEEVMTCGCVVEWQVMPNGTILGTAVWNCTASELDEYTEEWDEDDGGGAEG